MTLKALEKAMRKKNPGKGMKLVFSEKSIPWEEFVKDWDKLKNKWEIQFATVPLAPMPPDFDGKCLIYHKPKGDPLKIVYPRKNKPAKANTRKFNKANKDAGKIKAKRKIAKSKKKGKG